MLPRAAGCQLLHCVLLLLLHKLRVPLHPLASQLGWHISCKQYMGQHARSLVCLMCLQETQSHVHTLHTQVRISVACAAPCVQCSSKADEASCRALSTVATANDCAEVIYSHFALQTGSAQATGRRTHNGLMPAAGTSSSAPPSTASVSAERSRLRMHSNSTA